MHKKIALFTVLAQLAHFMTLHKEKVCATLTLKRFMPYLGHWQIPNLKGIQCMQHTHNTIKIKIHILKLLKNIRSFFN